MGLNLGDIYKKQQQEQQDYLNKNYESVDGIRLRNLSSWQEEQRLREEEEKRRKQLEEQSSLFKGGDSNLGTGLLASAGDFLLDLGQGFMRTLEGISDTSLYFGSDNAKFASKLLENTFGKNAISDFYAGVSDWGKEQAQFNSTQALFGTADRVDQSLFGNEWRENINQASYLGGLGDSIGEGIGNIGAMAALSAIGGAGLGAAGVGVAETGALTSGGKLALSGTTSFTSAYGNARSEAYKNGASDDEANKAGFINGLAEAISEQFFDSMPGIQSAGIAEKIGIKDAVANKLKKAMGSNVAKVFLRITGGLEEGAEEMISNALVAVGNDIMHSIDNNYTYGMDNQTGNIVEDFASAFGSQDSITSFISAGLTSAILGVGGDILTTAQQNQVINAFAKDNNMSFKEAKQLLTGETLQEAQKQVAREEKRENIELENDIEREDAAKKRILNYMKNTTSTNIETQIDQMEKQEGKTYTQEERESIRQQLKDRSMDEINNPDLYSKFTETARNEKDNDLIEQFRKANVNNSKEAHKMYEFVRKLQDNNQNAKYRIVNNEILKSNGMAAVDENGKVKGINGAYKDGEIIINLDSANPYEQVAYHEIGHAIKESTPELYEELKNLVYQLEGKEGLEQYRELYGVKKGELSSNLTDNVEDEYINDKLGEIASNKDFINGIADNRNLLQKIIDEIKRVLEYITSSKDQKKLMKLQNQLEQRLKEGYSFAQFEGKQSDKLSTQETKQEVKQETKQEVKQDNQQEELPFYYSLGKNEQAKEEVSLSYAKQRYNRNLGKYSVGDNLEDAYLEHQLRKDELDSLYEYAKKKAYNDSELRELERRYNELLERDEPNQANEIKYSLSAENYTDNQLNAIKSEIPRYVGMTKDQLNREYGYASDSYNEMLKLAEDLRKEYKELQKTDEFMDALQNYKFDSDIWKKGDQYAEKIRYYTNQADKYFAQREAINSILMDEQKDTRSAKQIAKEAEKHFGITNNVKEAGYITLNGNMLDFSGQYEGGQKGNRSLDHLEIGEIDTDRDSFIGMGNIRIKPENGGINLRLEPTDKQYSALRDFIEYAKENNDEIYVDIVTDDGGYASTQYNTNVSPTKVINDIKEYFETGTLPQQSDFSAFYSLSQTKDSQGNDLSIQQREYFKDSKIRDNEDRLIPLYHGSNSEFTIFDISKSGESSKEAKIGFWFTPNKKGAENFANEAWYGDKKPTTYEVYLNIKNPKIYETYEVDQQQRDNMLQNMRNLEQEIKDSSHKYSWTETEDYKITTLYHDLVEMNRKEVSGINDTQYNEEFYRRLAEERNISNEKFNEMNQDAKNQVELEQQNRTARDEYYTYVYSDAYEQFKTDLYLSAGMSAEDANVGGMGMMMKNENEAVANFVEKLKQDGYDGMIIKNTHYDSDSLGEGQNNDQYVAFYPNQIKNIDNLNPTENEDIRYQLSENQTESNLLKVIESYDDYLKTLPSYTQLQERETTQDTNLPYTDEKHGILTKEDYKNKKIELFDKKINTISNRMEEQAKRFARQNLELNRKATEELETIIDKYKGKSRETIINSDVKEEIRDFVKNNSKQEYVEEIVNDDIRNLQKEIRNTQLIIDKESAGEFADGITAFRKNNPGIKIKYGKSNIDSVYQELAETYPGMLETDVNDKDIPFILADILKKQYKQKGNTQIFELSDKEVEGITNRIYKGLTNNAISKEEIRKMAAEISQKVEDKYARTIASQKYREEAKETLDQIGLENIKDKKRGIQYKINTMKRNLRDIMDKDSAQLMYDKYFKPITIHNAQSEIDKQSYVERIQKYGLTNDESVYTQMLGELKYNPESDLTTDQLNDFVAKHNNIDIQKCTEAVEEFRNIYDELIVRVNESLKANGYKPIEYRQGYFPHFIEDKPDSIIGKFADKLGWHIQKGTLPTDIAGLTEGFKPGKAWTSFSQTRTGDTTDYNALKGMDNYLRGAMDLIYHTEDIQKLRALENELRYQYSEKGIQEKIDNIYANDELSPEEKAQEISLLVDNQKNNPLGNFVTELRDYTNALANKKSILDRGMEQSLGRDWYSIMNNINGRVSANMVGMNISSAMTNFIPITQAWSQVSTKNLMRGMYESIRNIIKNDGFDANSVYLTNRTNQADQLFKTKIDKVNEKLGMLFEGIDNFTSNTIVRAKYYENLEKGMSEQKAMENADEYAKDVMAGRSKGDQPTIFNTKNPLYKMFTAFQLEVNNQYGYMFKDLPADLGKEAKDKLAMAFVKMLLGAYLYNMISEKVTGRKAAFSPIDMAIDDIKTATSDMDFATKVQNIAKDVAQETPFLGGIMGGGRLPIQSAIPYENPLNMVTSTIEDIGKAFNEDTKDTAIKSLQKEWSKPLYFLALPFAGGQLKKTNEGLAMYNENLPIAGSYTNSGKLRFEADTSPLGVLQAAVFGQYASENAREYFAKGYSPLTENQINEALDANLPIGEYREVQQGLKKATAQAKENEESQAQAKVDYIYNLPISDEQKNVLVNNTLNRKTNIDLTNYGDYGSLDEFDYATKNPTKYETITQITDYSTYQAYKDEISNIKEQHSDTDSRKQAVFEYINSLPLNKYQKMMLEKMAGGYSIKNYKSEMQGYIESLPLTAQEKQSIDNELFS